MILYKYQGAGNDFLIADNRNNDISLSPDRIKKICDRRYGIGADGVMLLEGADAPYGFKMVYFNSDGSGGMMCGNGGRCIAAFAANLGISNLRFIAADGPHEAEILSSDKNTKIVRLKMKDVQNAFVSPVPETYYLDTGTRHLVVPTRRLSGCDVVGEGRKLRYLEAFAPIGTNVNFTELIDGTLYVRTYEKGVEDETFACGTGITASAIATWHATHTDGDCDGESVHVPVQALRDRLAVDFIPTAGGGARDIWLTGPATFVAEIKTFGI